MVESARSRRPFGCRDCSESTRAQGRAHREWCQKSRKGQMARCKLENLSVMLCPFFLTFAPRLISIARSIVIIRTHYVEQQAPSKRN
jgi:hypothetical protein